MRGCLVVKETNYVLQKLSTIEKHTQQATVKYKWKQSYHLKKDWIWGFARRIGNVDAIRAELWGIWKGIKRVWDMGSRHVVLETDLKAALRTCNLTLGWREANS